ncbi:hypothetical protein ACEWY4_010630 [Coilia grayii]|uniref:Protection of telomeres protein 1 n=1 Tax=Coilia grayii TaxID=363190 RepID=A0ABD1K322_9TELE
MPIHIIQDPLQDIPKTLQNIPIPTLTEKSDCAGKYVKGKVVFKGPLVSRGDHLNYILKIVIQEDAPQQSKASNYTSINVMLFGGLAKDFSHHAIQGDTVVPSGFTVSPSPTFKKDGQHPCSLHLDGDKACVYVLQASAPAEKKSGVNSTPKYTYVPLKELKLGSVVNVYAVVTFFKVPYPSKGTDYCSTLKLADQSGATVVCTVFSKNQDNQPKIFKTGDVIRLHRVKAYPFEGSIALVTSWGWSAVTFDGTVGTPVVPRTNSKSFHFGEEDRRAVTELREWAANVPPEGSSVPLSAVKPKQFFNLTCQLLAKATMDSTCTLLKVWDGSRCGYPLLTVPVEEGALEGGSPAVTEGQNLIANVLVYDNHVEVAQALKPGAFLCINNLHAVAQPGTSELSFHLHGGASYSRGICVLPLHSPEVSKLKSALQACAEQMEDDMNTCLGDMSSLTQLHATNGGPETSSSVRKCTHSLPQVSLAQVKSSPPPQFVHVRAQLSSYQPRRLYQCLKLFCSQCKAIEDVPDAESLRERFEAAAKDSMPCRVPWAVTVATDTDDAGRKIALHVSSTECPADRHSRLVFVQGATFQEMCRLSSEHEYMLPVRSSAGELALLDSTVPFLFRGKRHFYGCQQCSKGKVVKSPAVTTEVWNERNISEALGVQLMQHVAVMKLQLDDGTATLDTLLFEGSEDFFGVSADGMAYSQEAQDSVQQTMDMLLPADSSTLQRPWLDLCLCLYAAGENGETQVQIVNTHIRKHPIAE